MSPGRVLQYFDQISEAPDAVSRLRQFILNLAVRGKLVEQDPGDEPAAELLGRIAAARARFNRADETQSPKPHVPINDDVPFSIPET